MEQQNAFTGATSYTRDSIERCHHLAEFIKKRQAIEEEYARSLRKLCKSVSLTPFQQPPKGNKSSGPSWWKWWGRRSTGQKVESAIPSEEVTKTSLWSTFYEIIDDTSQTALAESLQHQLLEPLNASIREMEAGRDQIVEQGNKMIKDLDDTAAGLKKARRRFDKSNKEAVANRSALEKLNNNRALGSSREMEALQVKTRKAEEGFSLARQAFRQQEEALKNLYSKVYSQELPRIMTKLQQQEVQRSREALSYILGLIELERRCAVMNENYANDMAVKLKQINLIHDEQKFTTTFMSVPLPPPLPVQPTNTTTNATTAGVRVTAQPQPMLQQPARSVAVASPSDIPRTLSMPPAYESQASAGLQDLAHYQGAASTNVLSTFAATLGGDHSRQVTIELPSQP